jgi:hypothetical protein
MALANKKLCVNGYDELKTLVKNTEKDKRIFVLFYGSKDSQGHSWYMKNSNIWEILFYVIQVSR